MDRTIREEDEIKLNRLVDSLGEKLDLKTSLAREAMKAAIINVKLLDEKQQDYGSSNLTKFGTYGVLVRLNDKVERLANLKKSDSTPKNETLVDSWQDAANYGLIGFLMESERWGTSI